MYDIIIPVLKKTPKQPKVRSFRPTVEDDRILRELKEKFGVHNESEVIRMGLKKLAQAQGVQ